MSIPARPPLDLLAYVGYRARWYALPQAARRFGAASRLLLPRPDYGWLAATREHHAAGFATHATGYGISAAQYTELVGERLSAWAPSARLQIRMDSEAVPRFLADRRYRNQFETGTTKGAFAPGRRMLIEHAALGVPMVASARYRPTYGYLTGSNEAGLVPQYGDAVLQLRLDVNFRSTFTCGDSLDEITRSQPYAPFCPAPLVDPGPVAVPAAFDLLSVPELWQACGPHQYIEAQIFGDITPADIETVVFTRGFEPSSTLQQELESAKIQRRIVEGDVP